ncbi:uncharacterized protein LOC125190547 [Salvia hispanica]|uniref:uncharacterized protein LOC125190547 n=1 Tax=Salvia hispanica TaxID=49212 RepID=UPI0020092DEC|nr:uncharacterized protein LOC125190547 [Salvia hispanica]
MEQDDCYQSVTETKYDCLLFDVDDTLYPLSSGISTECTKNIREYMISKLGIEEEKVPEMCAELYKDYGTTMAGLRAVGYDFDYDDYHSFVHGRLPYDWLKTDHTLKNLLQTVPIRKVIFSNGNDAHVAEVLSRLGVQDCFESIICFETLNPSKTSEQPEDTDATELPKTPILCKPLENSFVQAFKIAGINPQKTLFFDDSIRNLQTAKSVGLHTVWVGSSHKTDGVDYSLESIHNMKEAFPELWEGAVDKADAPYPEKAAIEAVV